ncbi:GPI-anchored small secreted protein [Amanita muscaria]
MRSLSILFLLAASALGYQIMSPNSAKGWTNSGPQLATWQRVDTDASNFTALLVNQNHNVLTEGSQVLSALVDGSSLSINFYAPSAGWPLGDGFRLNFVKDVTDPNTIYAQSDEFTIKAVEQPKSSSFATSSPSSPFIIPTTSANPNTVMTVLPKASSTSGGDNTAQATGTSNDALRFSDGHVIVLSLSSLFGFFLAV